MPAAPDPLRAQLHSLAHWIRDPQNSPPPPGIEPRRLQIYRGLFRGNLDGLLSAQFPVIKRLRGPEFWAGLVDGFLREHRAQTPLFPEVGREFIAYLQARAEDGLGDPPFLPELAHYEWAELGIALDPSDPTALECNPVGDLMREVPVLSPLAWPLAYVWPVDRIRADFQPEQPPAAPSLFLLQRRADHSVAFARLEPLGFALLQQLREAPTPGQALVQQLAQLAGAQAQDFEEPARRMLESLRARGVILGTRAPERQATGG
jgi:hypothetical protein